MLFFDLPLKVRNMCTDSPSSYEQLRPWREFVKRVAISHERNVIIGGYVPEGRKNYQKKK
jgi:hypothetical protein